MAVGSNAMLWCDVVVFDRYNFLVELDKLYHSYQETSHLFQLISTILLTPFANIPATQIPAVTQIGHL
jgi:hypothetical protein